MPITNHQGPKKVLLYFNFKSKKERYDHAEILLKANLMSLTAKFF